MTPGQARRYLEALAAGVDPETGEVFPPESPYQRADTVRALYAAIRALERDTARPNRPPRTGSSWDDAEDERLRAGFDAGHTADELAAAHGRTPGAIRSRLERLGLIEHRARFK